VTKLYNKSSTLQFRRQLRRNQPATERLFWSKIRNRQLLGFKFRRQYSIGKFIVDYCCPEAKLIVEIDGDSHYSSNKSLSKDRVRQKYLESLGFNILRFTNKDITGNLEASLEKLYQRLNN